jgi:hypothetical protein
MNPLPLAFSWVMPVFAMGLMFATHVAAMDVRDPASSSQTHGVPRAASERPMVPDPASPSQTHGGPPHTVSRTPDYDFDGIAALNEEMSQPIAADSESELLFVLTQRKSSMETKWLSREKALNELRYSAEGDPICAALDDTERVLGSCIDEVNLSVVSFEKKLETVNDRLLPLASVSLEEKKAWMYRPTPYPNNRSLD